MFYGEQTAGGVVNWSATGKALSNNDVQDSVWAYVPSYKPKDTVYGSSWRTRYEPANTVVGENGETMPDTMPALSGNVLTYVLDTEYHRQKVAVTPNIVEEGYEQIELTRLGWINFDHFYTAAKTELAIDLPAVEQHVRIKTYIVYKSLNSVSAHELTTNEQDNHAVISGLPTNQQVRITAIAYYDGKMHAYTQDIKLKPHTHIDMQMKTVSDKELTQLFTMVRS